jgi:DNA-binding transcriptional LysR family regulator
VDGGFVAGEDHDPRLTVTAITCLEFAVAAPESSKRSGSKIKLATLDGANLISPVAQEPSHQQLIDAIREHGAITIQDAFGIDTIRSLVGAGLGFSLAPKGSIEPSTPGIRLLEPDPPLPSIQVGIATRTADESRQAKAVRSIAQHLTD